MTCSYLVHHTAFQHSRYLVSSRPISLKTYPSTLSNPIRGLTQGSSRRPYYGNTSKTYLRVLFKRDVYTQTDPVSKPTRRQTGDT